MTVGDSNSPVWSGLYFLSNYVIMILLLLDHNDKPTKLVGISLCSAIILFIVSKFFISLDVEKLRYLNALTFSLIFLGLYKLDRKK